MEWREKKVEEKMSTEKIPMIIKPFHSSSKMRPGNPYEENARLLLSLEWMRLFSMCNVDMQLNKWIVGKLRFKRHFFRSYHEEKPRVLYHLKAILRFFASNFDGELCMHFWIKKNKVCSFASSFEKSLFLSIQVFLLGMFSIFRILPFIT